MQQTLVRFPLGVMLALALGATACSDDSGDGDGDMPMETEPPPPPPPTGTIDSGAPPVVTGNVDSGVPPVVTTDAAPPPAADAGVDSGGSDTGDAGTDAGTDAGDACSSVSDPCSTAGVTCDGDELVTCAADGNGCLVETRDDCTAGSNNFCDDSDATPVCGFDPCLEVADPCDTAGTACDGNTLVTCALDGDDCLVETRSDCVSGGTNTCDPTGTAACAYDKCKDDEGNDKADVCLVDQTTCAEDVLVTCVEDTDECPIATRIDCTTDGSNNRCNDTLDPPACDVDPCREVDNPCFPEGVVCEGTEVVSCAPDSNDCLVETRQDCADMGASFTCADADPDADGGAGGPTCETCSDAAACAGLGEGDTLCDGNTRVRCSDVTGDGCLNAVRENCGADFTCCTAMDDPTGCPAVAQPACVFSGSDTCDSDVEMVLDAAGSYGPFDTNGAGNDFNGYPCPDPSLPFNAASPDLLFAIDIPSGTALSVSFSSQMSFGSTGVWMLQLSSCADDGPDQAEDSCVDVSNMSLTQANEGDTTSRFYLVIDADDIFPATDNVGTFGLDVDIRPLECGDGNQDGSEECDDANNLPDDGCAPDCTLEGSFVCTESTESTPSVCTLRPDDGICGNVQCDPVPGGAPTGTELCCTTGQECGVALPDWYGGSCLLRDQEGAQDTGQCGTADSGIIGFFFGFPDLPGCCTPEGECGWITDEGAGCVERTALWQAMLDGPASAIYDEADFDALACTP